MNLFLTALPSLFETTSKPREHHSYLQLERTIAYAAWKMHQLVIERPGVLFFFDFEIVSKPRARGNFEGAALQ